MAIFDFESIFVEDDGFKYTEANDTTKVGKHNSTTVSISSILVKNPIFLCKVTPRDLLSSFVDALENLATHKKAQMKRNNF